MTDIALSPEAVARLKTLAQEATPGPWEYFVWDGGVCIGSQTPDEILFETPQEIPTKLTSREKGNNAAYIAAVHPGVILAMCEEIEQLRNMRLDQMAETLASLLNAAASAATDEEVIAAKLGTECPYCGYESSSFEDAKAHDATCPKHPAVIRAVRLEKEANWLAIELEKRERGCKWCEQYHNSCIPSFVPCGYKGPDNWREAARKAVEEDSHE